HGDGNHQIAPGAELDETGPAGGRSLWYMHGGHDFVRPAGREAIAQDEFAQGNPPRRLGGAQFDFRVENEQRRQAVGRWRGVAEIAGDRARVLNLDRTDLVRGQLQGVEGRG